ncbi:MAG: alpha/beta hydrolase [Terriglobia bacterium]
MTAATRNSVTTHGSGQTPIVFAHGFGCDQNMWRYVEPAFRSRYLTILFDHVGAGHSDPAAWDPAKYRSLDGYATDVLEILTELALPPAIFVGHSVSAMIGVLAAIRRPELFSHLILVGPSPCYINSGDYTGGFNREDIEGLLEVLDSNYLGWSSTMAPVIMGNADHPELGQELTESFCRTDPAIARHFARATFLSDNRADLARLRTPVLILQCAEDAIAPTVVGEYVHRSLPNSRFVQLQATGHCPNLSAPEETAAAINDYLANA